MTHVREEEDLLVWQVGRDLQAVGVGCGQGQGASKTTTGESLLGGDIRHTVQKEHTDSLVGGLGV
jgi:hypothetical protein